MYVLYFCLGKGKSSSELKPAGLNSIVKKYSQPDVQVQQLKSINIFNNEHFSGNLNNKISSQDVTVLKVSFLYHFIFFNS